MKRTLIITGIVVVTSFILLFVFNTLTTKKDKDSLFAEVQKGDFEIALSITGELVAEKSIEIQGPEFSQRRDIRSTNIRIQDLVPEGTIVKQGDYIATLDRTELNNNLKDEKERLETFKTNLEMKILDTAVVLNGLRDEIKNQESRVEEAAMTFRNSKYEPPTTIRQAEIELDKAQRILEQRRRGYTRRLAQCKTDIYNLKYWTSRISKRVTDLEEVLAGFTITAPAPGMVVYKKEWRGNKRKVGSFINPFDRVVALLPDLSSLVSKTYVSEIDVTKVKAGQSVKITIDAFPGKSFTGVISSVANIGEQLPNSDDKVFEVLTRIDGNDPLLRPSMTTGNRIMIKKIPDAVFIPTECVQTGTDKISYVYTKNGTKQVVLLGDSNDKNIVVEKGLKPGTLVYLTNPENPEKFKLLGEDLIPVIRERRDLLREANGDRFLQQAHVDD
jgi:HlyD family secretion protein